MVNPDPLSDLAACAPNIDHIANRAFIAKFIIADLSIIAGHKQIIALARTLKDVSCELTEGSTGIDGITPGGMCKSEALNVNIGSRLIQNKTMRTRKGHTTDSRCFHDNRFVLCSGPPYTNGICGGINSICHNNAVAG